jgi:hypothetical protein
MKLAEIHEFLTFLEAEKGVWTVAFYMDDASRHPIITENSDCISASLRCFCNGLAEVTMYEVDARELRYKLTDISWESEKGCVRIQLAEKKLKLRSPSEEFLARARELLDGVIARHYTISMKLSA